MTVVDKYKTLAADLHTRARNEPSPNLKAEWDHLAECYELLAQQAEKNFRIETRDLANITRLIAL